MHRVSGFLVEQGANILEAAQFDDVGANRFFMRVQFELGDAATTAAALHRTFCRNGTGASPCRRILPDGDAVFVR